MEEYIFKKVSALVGKLRRHKKVEDYPAVCLLSDISASLTILARAITGVAITIATAERGGGWVGSTFFLPAHCSATGSVEDNGMFYLFRVCFLASQKSLELNWPPHQQHSVEESEVTSLSNADVVLEKVFQEFPSLIKFHSRMVDAGVYPWMLYGR